MGSEWGRWPGGRWGNGLRGEYGRKASATVAVTGGI